MAKYKIFTTREFDVDFGKLDNSIKEQIMHEIDQLENYPFVGKPLGYKFFREKKVKKYRIYYLVYEDYVVVFVIAISDKKDQQKAINQIKYLMPYYKSQIKERLNL